MPFKQSSEPVRQGHEEEEGKAKDESLFPYPRPGEGGETCLKMLLVKTRDAGLLTHH